MISGIGCDIVSINRIKKQKNDFYKRILTSKEQAIYLNLSSSRQLEFLAGRFAAKEAIYKANNEIKLLSNIEILNNEKGKPCCQIEGLKIQISIAHEKDYAIAYAICEKNN